MIPFVLIVLAPAKRLRFLLSGQCEAVHKKQMLFIDAPLRMAVRAVKGGRGEPFIGAQRRPLTEEAGGAGACFAAEEQLSFVKSFLPIGGC
jgi:hypothetical protein